jgi:CpeS-like protein
MDIREFFELSAGKWFSQKTSHHLTLKQSEQGKSDLEIEILPNDNPQILQLCQQAGVDPILVWGGAKYTWQGTVSWDTHPQNSASPQGETISISVPDRAGSNTGQLFHLTNTPTRFPTGAAAPTVRVARYQMGDDNALTLVTKLEQTQFDERIWFESDNVRLRTTIVTQANGDSLASFYSEIRRMG